MTKTEYTREEAFAIIGLNVHKFDDIIKTGKIKRTRRGHYSRESVDAFQKDRQERLAIEPPKWIKGGHFS